MSQDENNPYSPPGLSEEKNILPGIWRYEDLLVISHSNEVPSQRCIKTNEPTKQAAWFIHGPLLFRGRSAVVSFGLSQRLYVRRVWRHWIAVAALAIGLCLMFSGVIGLWVVLPRPPVETATSIDVETLVIRIIISLFIIIIGLCVALVGVIFQIINTFQFRVCRTTQHHFFLKGAHRDFLARFAEFPRS